MKRPCGWVLGGLAFMALALVVASGCFGPRRWPVADLHLDGFAITKDRTSQVIACTVSPRTLSSAVWPRVRVIEEGPGVLIVACERELVGMTDLRVFTSPAIIVGQRVVVLLRDEEDRLHLVGTITVQDGATPVNAAP